MDEKPSFKNHHSTGTTHDTPESIEQLKEIIREKDRAIARCVEEISVLQEELFLLSTSLQKNGKGSQSLPAEPAPAKNPGFATPPPDLQKITEWLQQTSEKLNKDASQLQLWVSLIRSSAFFDEEWYRHQYPDVAQCSADPAEHYLLHGAAEGRNPSPLFDTLFYCGSNPDLLGCEHNPLIHFLQHGQDEGRLPLPS